MFTIHPEVFHPICLTLLAMAAFYVRRMALFHVQDMQSFQILTQAGLWKSIKLDLWPVLVWCLFFVGGNYVTDLMFHYKYMMTPTMIVVAAIIARALELSWFTYKARKRGKQPTEQ